LKIAHRDVVEKGVAEYVVERPRFGDVATRLADHHGELALVVELHRDLRTNDRRLCRHKGCCHAQEKGGIGRDWVSAFLGMQRIIEANADELRRGSDWQRGYHGLERALGGCRCLGRGGGHGSERGRAGGDQRLKIFRKRCVDAAEIDDRCTFDQSQSRHT
jgi:hypothetical protein